MWWEGREVVVIGVNGCKVDRLVVGLGGVFFEWNDVLEKGFVGFVVEDFWESCWEKVV